MGFIKDAWNIKVFLLVVLVAVSMVSLLLVFQRNFEDINTRYHSKLEQLNETFDQLTGAQTQLNRTIEDLEVQTLKEEDLRDKYTEVRDERDLLETERNDLRTEVAEKSEEIGNLNARISALNEDIDDLNARINRLEDKLDRCRDSLGTDC